MEIQRVRVNRNLWKTNLTREIIHLEDNLEQIYTTAGLKPRRVVSEDENDEGALATNDKRPIGEIGGNFELAIDELVGEVRQAVDNICALISSVTEFDLPIPVLVLLKLAGRVSSIRCMELTRKIPGSMAKRYIYGKKSLDLIESGLQMYKWISIILGTNILPFQAHINQNLISILEWTRTSNLCKYDESRYYSIRSQVIETFTGALEQLSLNLNLDSRQLGALIDSELIKTLEDSFAPPAPAAAAGANESAVGAHASPGAVTSIDQRKRTPLASAAAASGTQLTLKDKYTGHALVCLDRLFVVYADYLGAKLESRLKSFIIQTSIGLYRDFERADDVIGLAGRRLLLRLLETIANRPYATSTSELAWHIFEHAERLESDPEIRFLCRRAVKFGLAHRPIVVSHFDVFDCQAGALPTLAESKASELSLPAPQASALPAPETRPNSLPAPESHVNASPAPVSHTNASPSPGSIASESPAKVLKASEAPSPASKANGLPALASKAGGSPSPVSKASEVQSLASKASELPAQEPQAGESPAPASQVSSATTPVKAAPPAAKASESSESASTLSAPAREVAEQPSDNVSISNGLDEQVQSYLDLFVDEPAATSTQQEAPVLNAQ